MLHQFDSLLCTFTSIWVFFCNLANFASPKFQGCIFSGNECKILIQVVRVFCRPCKHHSEKTSLNLCLGVQVHAGIILGLMQISVPVLGKYNFQHQFVTNLNVYILHSMSLRRAWEQKVGKDKCKHAWSDM